MSSLAGSLFVCVLNTHTHSSYTYFGSIIAFNTSNVKFSQLKEFKRFMVLDKCVFIARVRVDHAAYSTTMHLLDSRIMPPDINN